MHTISWHDIVAFAGRSPSTHNTQGWRLVREDDDRLALYFDETRTLPAEDRDGSFNIVNMGVFTRALEIGAALEDVTLRTAFDLGSGPSGRASPSRSADLSGPAGPSGAGKPSRAVGQSGAEAVGQSGAEAVARSGAEGHVRVATLHAEPGGDDELRALREPFLARRTGRFPYDGRPVPEGELAEIGAGVASAGHRFGWTHDPDTIRWIMELNADTIVQDLQERPIRRELMEWTRYTRRQAEASGDGLWARCMNQSPLELWLTYRLPWLLRIGPIRRRARKRYLASQGGTATIGWIAGRLDDEERCFETGRMMLDWWIDLTRRGIQMLPYGSLYTRPESHRRIAERIGAPDWWIVVRMGYAPEPPRSYRLPPDRLWIDGASETDA